MISALKPYKLNPDETEMLLKRLEDWRFGICPNGKLANKGCFVLETRPNIVIQPDITKPVATQIITDSEWTENLVSNGTIQHINDNALINTLADLYMIFGSTVLHRVTYGVHKVHAIQIRKYATISMDAILRPTMQMKESIEMALAETDVNIRWHKLLEFWDEYGYFWPRKIIFGFRTYLQKTFSFRDRYEQFNRYHSTNSSLRGDLNKSNLPIADIPEFLERCEIVGRNDLIPLHELLDDEWKDRIESLIKEKFVRILINQPIKIYNRSKKSYLCWSQRHSGNGTIDSMFIVKPLQQSEIQSEKGSQYLWNFGWTSKRDVTLTAGLDYDTTNYRPQIIRGGERVYIFPGCKTRVYSRSAAVLNNQHASQQTTKTTTITDSKLSNTDKLILSRLSYKYQGASHQDPGSRIRPLKLSSTRDHAIDEITNWTIEYRHNQLKYAMDSDYHVKLNINEYIRRLKPLIQGDEIQLQQIGLLTAFDTDETAGRPSTSSPILHPRNTRYFQQREAIMFKSKRTVRCMDEDMVHPETVADTYWVLQLATVEDQKRHFMDSRNVLESSGHNQRPNLTTSHTTTCLENGYSNQHYQQQHQQQQTDPSHTIRRTQSDSSIPTTTGNVNHEDRAAHFESLAKSSTSKLLMKFMKRVTLQPLVQLVNPARTRQSPNNQQAHPSTINQTNTRSHEYPTRH